MKQILLPLLILTSISCSRDSKDYPYNKQLTDRWWKCQASYGYTGAQCNNEQILFAGNNQYTLIDDFGTQKGKWHWENELQINADGNIYQVVSISDTMLVLNLGNWGHFTNYK